MTCYIRLEPDNLVPENELSAFLARAKGNGAIVTFVGVTRPTDKDGHAVDALYLDHYPGMTERTLREIASDATARFDPATLTIIHRVGRVDADAPIVFVAAASPHRRVAFLAADYVMDRLKTDAGFWKREETRNGARWIEPTPQDHTDCDRWSHAHARN